MIGRRTCDLEGRTRMMFDAPDRSTPLLIRLDSADVHSGLERGLRHPHADLSGSDDANALRTLRHGFSRSGIEVGRVGPMLCVNRLFPCSRLRFLRKLRVWHFA